MERRDNHLPDFERAIEMIPTLGNDVSSEAEVYEHGTDLLQNKDDHL